MKSTAVVMASTINQAWKVASPAMPSVPIVRLRTGAGCRRVMALQVRQTGHAVGHSNTLKLSSHAPLMPPPTINPIHHRDTCSDTRGVCPISTNLGASCASAAKPPNPTCSGRPPRLPFASSPRYRHGKSSGIVHPALSHRRSWRASCSAASCRWMASRATSSIACTPTCKRMQKARNRLWRWLPRLWRSRWWRRWKKKLRRWMRMHP